MLCNLILSLTTQPATVRKNTGLREQFALGGPFVQPASSACFRRFFSAAISAISRANFSLHAASVWTETLVPFVSRSLSGSREAGTLQFPEKPLVQGLHVVVHTCRLPCSATQHTTETKNSQGHGELLSNCYHFWGVYCLNCTHWVSDPEGFLLFTVP